MASKLRVAGYEYVNLDCGYSTKRRDAQGKLVVNTTRYPHGMTWLGERIHSLGLKFGMCARQHPSAPHGHPAAGCAPRLALLEPQRTHCAGCCTDGAMGWGQCCSQIDPNATDGTGPGCSRGGQCRTDSFYDQDAELWASWGVDFLKCASARAPCPRRLPLLLLLQL